MSKRVLIVYKQHAVARTEILHMLSELATRNIDAIIIRSAAPYGNDFVIYDLDKLEDGEIEAIKILVQSAQAL